MPTEIAWPLTSEDVESLELPRVVEASRGVARPFRRDGKGDFANVSGRASIRAAIGQILGTLATSPISRGELAWRPSFGSIVDLLRHRNGDDVLAELLRVYVVESIQVWEPRVRLTDATVDVTRAPVITVRLRYDEVGAGGGTLVAGVNDVHEIGLAA